jgi:hypothetical protein
MGLITARGNVDEELERQGRGAGDIEAWIEGDARLDAVGRLNIYNNMYYFRLLDSLAEDFPMLQAVLGEDAFARLVTAYVETHPPERPSLRDAGRRLPTFVTAWAQVEETDVDAGALADLAALEWARVDVFDDADCAVLTAAHLGSVGAEDVAALPLHAVPASRLLRLAHGAHLIWRAVDRAQPIPAVEAQPTLVLVWRQERAIFHRALEDDESEAAARIVTGTTFGAICELLGQTRDELTAATEAAALLQRWVHDGVLRAI